MQRGPENILVYLNVILELRKITEHDFAEVVLYWTALMKNFEF